MACVGDKGQRRKRKNVVQIDGVDGYMDKEVAPGKGVRNEIGQEKRKGC